MNANFHIRLVGGSFIAAALMMWLGWVLLPVKIGAFFDPNVFGQIHDQFHLWIWIYRVHLFGMIVTVIALFALMALVAQSPSRILIWPGAAVASSGMLVSALAAAFYYHHGAWGSLGPAASDPDAAKNLVEALKIETEYVTCLTRFGRVFGGLGLLTLAWGIARWKLLPIWSACAAAIIGIAAMALTMALPDQLTYYQPIFHTHALWMAATGLHIWRRGIVEGGSPSVVPLV